MSTTLPQVCVILDGWSATRKFVGPDLPGPHVGESRNWAERISFPNLSILRLRALSEVVASPVQNPSEAFRRTYPHTGGFRVRSEREKQPPGGTHDIAGNQHLLTGYPNFQLR